MPTHTSPQRIAPLVKAAQADDDLDADDLADLLVELAEDPREREAAEDAAELRQLLRSLRACREASGLAQRAVAKKMGTQQSAVSDLEGGASDPQVSTLLKYARAIGIRLPLRLVAPGRATPEAARWRSTTAPRSASSRVKHVDHTGVVIAPLSWGRERKVS